MDYCYFMLRKDRFDVESFIEGRRCSERRMKVKVLWASLPPTDTLCGREP